VLLLFLLFYALPVYLVFVQFEWIRPTRAWKVALALPPLFGLLFFWYGIGRYAPISQDAYVQAPVAQVAPEVAGLVDQVLVADNTAVVRGTPLFRIDPKPYQFAADQALAKLHETREQAAGLVAATYAADEGVRQAEANLAVNQKGLLAAEADLKLARETLVKAKAQLALDQANSDRATAAFAKGAVSREELDKAVRSLTVSKADATSAELVEAKARIGAEAATARLAAAESAGREAKTAKARALVLIDPVDALKQSLTALTAERALQASDKSPLADPAARDQRVRELDAEIARFRRFVDEAKQSGLDRDSELPRTRQAREAWNRAGLDLKRTTVTAPCDGIVTNLQVTPGTYAAPGKPLVTVIATDRWRLVIPVLENGTAKMKVGDEVRFALRNYPGSFRTGTVTSVGRGVIAGQGQPGGTLPDTQPRIARTLDSPEQTQDFQVIVAINDDVPDQPLRVGATGRAVVFNDGGLAGVNQVAIILTTILSYTDFFNPKPSAALVLLGLLVVCALLALLRYLRSAPLARAG
jgi:membrane fusion protein, multidrug efflux system